MLPVYTPESHKFLLDTQPYRDSRHWKCRWLGTICCLAHTSPTFSCIPATDYYPHFKTFLYNRWQSFWSGLNTNKLQAIKPSISPWSAPYHQNRCWETALACVWIGHTQITHSYLIFFFFYKTSKFMLIFSVKSSPYSHVKNLIIQWIFIRACIRKIFVIPSQILLFTM